MTGTGEAAGKWIRLHEAAQMRALCSQRIGLHGALVARRNCEQKVRLAVEAEHQVGHIGDVALQPAVHRHDCAVAIRHWLRRGR